MSELLTLQDLANGHLDIKALGEAANGDENTIVTTRTGNTYPSAERAINIMFQNGGLPAKPFATKAQMETDGTSLADGQLAIVYNETANNGLYVKKTGAWVKSDYDPIEAANSYTDNALRTERILGAEDIKHIGNLWKDDPKSDTRYNHTIEYIPVYPSTEKITLSACINSPNRENPICLFYDDKKTLLPESAQEANRVRVVGVFTLDIVIPNGAAYVRFGTMNNTHPSYVPHEFKAIIYDKALGLVEAIPDITKQLSLLGDRAAVFTLADFNTDLQRGETTSKTKWIPVDEYNYIGMRNFLKGIGPIIEVKESEFGEVWELVSGTSAYEPYFDVYKIPPKVKYIKVKARTVKHLSYRDDFSAAFTLSKTAESAKLYLFHYLVGLTREVVFDRAATVPITNPEKYIESNRIMVLSDSELYIKTHTDNIVGYEYSTLTRVFLPISKDALTLVEDGEYAGYYKYVSSLQGFVTLLTYSSLHPSYDPAFVTDVRMNNKKVLGNLPSSLPNTVLQTSLAPVGITGRYLDSPVLKSIRHQVFEDGTTKIPLQYLWYDKDNNFYLSNSKRGTRTFLFKWEASHMHGGMPHHFSMDFDYFGNILCSYRNEHLDYSLYDDNVRKDPIILVKEDDYKAVTVDFAAKISADPTLVRPSGWVMNCGFLATTEEVIFAEYTRPSVQTANTWRVTYPITNPDNWSRVQSFTISSEMNPPDTMKHLHSVDLDPFTGHVYTSSGDQREGAGIYVSTDKGRTFNTLSRGVEAISRLLGFTFRDDFIWWATDSHGDKHRLYKAPRIVGTGVLDIDNIVEVLRFPSTSEATYATIYFENLDALLFLGRADGAKTSIPIEVWDFKNETLSTVGTLESVSGNPETFGFRCECFEYTPRDNEMICGFSIKVGAYSTYLNRIKGFGNTGIPGATVNNLTYSLSRNGNDFYLSQGTVI